MYKGKILYHAKSIYDIDLKQIKNLGYKYLICDLDNTLDDRDEKTATDKAKQFAFDVKEMGLELIIVSNNTKKKVSVYADSLKVKYLHSALKYFTRRVLYYLNSLNIDVKDCLFIGDQIFSDYLYIRRIDGDMLLTEPLTSNDNFYTKVIRIFDIIIRKHWLKKGKLGKELSK